MAEISRGTVVPSIASLLIQPANKITGLLTGEAIDPGDACYINNSDGLIYKSKAITLATPTIPVAGSHGTTGGTLIDGVYNVVISYVTAAGIESASSVPLAVTLSGGTTTQTLVINKATTSSGASTFNIYVTAVGGSIYYLQSTGTAPAGSGTVTITSIATNTAQPPFPGNVPESGVVRGFAASKAPLGEACTLLMDMNLDYGLALPTGANCYLSAATAGMLATTPASASYLPVGYVVDSERIHIWASQY